MRGDRSTNATSRAELALHPLGELALASTDLEHAARLPRLDRAPEDLLRVGALGALPERLTRPEVRLARVLLAHDGLVVERHQALLGDEDRACTTGERTAPGRPRADWRRTATSRSTHARTPRRCVAVRELEARRRCPPAGRARMRTRKDVLAVLARELQASTGRSRPARAARAGGSASSSTATSRPPGRSTRASSATPRSRSGTW